MKTHNSNIFQSLAPAELNQLITEVKETVATNIPQTHPKNAFGVVDLWNLERSRRTRIARRHYA